MLSTKLGSYLRTYRIGTGLTQKDVAALLGMKTGSTISKTEKGKGIPPILVLLGYCILFEVHPKDLVPKIFNDIEQSICTRAVVVAGQLQKRHKTPMVLARLKFLENLSQLSDDTCQKHEQ